MIKILEGENTFLSKKRLETLIQENIKGNPDISIKIIPADSKKIGDILNEYETQDMFSPKKLVVIKRLLSNKEYKDFLERILETQEKNETHLILWEEKNIPKNTNYYKLFNKLGVIESFPSFNKRTFMKWADEQVKISELKIDNEALNKFVEMSNYDTSFFINELEKLKLADKEIITVEDLQKNTEDMYSNSIWEFIDAINQGGKQAEYTKILINLLKNGLDPHYLMIMMARNLKQLMLVKKMLEDSKDDKEILSVLKIPPFTLPRLKSISKKADYQKLLKLYEKIYNLNYETKIGNIDADLGLILLITRLN